MPSGSGLKSQPIPNLVMGVSQQNVRQRRDSQCEAQLNCLNSPEAGAVARNGLEVTGYYPTLDLTNCWHHELRRGEEHYIIYISGGQVLAYNLKTGLRCSVALQGSAQGYVYNDSPYVDWAAYRAQTVDDYTFIAKRGKKIAMAPTRSPSRIKEALLFVRAGAYSCIYTMSFIRVSGGTISYSLETPDNSTAANSPYIDTNAIAASFYNSMTGAGASTPGYGSVGSTALTDHGYSVGIDGNIIHVYRNDGEDFAVTVSDGQGGGGLQVFKDTVDNISNLPKYAPPGFVIGVKGRSNTSQSDQGQIASDYFVQFQGATYSTGTWNECVKPNTPTNLDPATMPHAIRLDGPNAFSVLPMVWSSRVVGDGVNSSLDPYFVGKSVEDLFYAQQRLGIMTDASVSFSKARNPFTFFPDTLQTILADAPIDIRLAGSEAVAVLRRVLQVDEGLHLWAQRSQFRVSQGQNASFSQDTIQAPETTSYEFAENANFGKVAAVAYFATEGLKNARIRSLSFQQSKPAGDTDITAHVPAYIKNSVRQLSVNDTGQLMVVRTDGAPTGVYLYNYLVEGNNVVQSAWSRWEFPCQKVLWVGFEQDIMCVFLQRNGYMLYCRLPLDPHLVDDEPGSTYRTRLDLRTTEAGCLMTYDALDNWTDINVVNFPIDITDPDPVVVCRAPSTGATGAYVRGEKLNVLLRAGNVVRVKGDMTTTPFYLGLPIVSRRDESQFFLRSKDGVQPMDRLTIREFRVALEETGYTRLEASVGAGRPVVMEETRPIIMGTDQVNLGAPITLLDDELHITVDSLASETSLSIINDSHFPSRWQTAEYTYEGVKRASSGGAG